MHFQTRSVNLIDQLPINKQFTPRTNVDGFCSGQSR